MPETHIHFQKIDIEYSRFKQPLPIPKPEREHIQHGHELQVKITELKGTFAESIQQPEFDPALIFRLKTEGYVDDNEWRRSGLTVLSEESDGAIVLFSEDLLEEFSSRITQYGGELEEGQKNPSYHWIASVTSDLRLWSREDRIGMKLANIDIDPQTLYRIDVELWHYGTQDQCSERLDSLRTFVQRNNGQYLDAYLGSTLSLARIEVNGDVLNNLLDLGDVHTIDTPPQPQLSVGHLLNTPIDDFHTPIPSPPDDAPSICIIDSGIGRGHPLLANAIGDTVAIPESLGDGLDNHGHGTQVAGIALYGDVKEHIENLDFRPDLYLFGAKVTNSENRFDDNKLIVNQMRDAIQYFHNNYSCRIFNLSLGDPHLIYQGGKPSAWAHILDSLARELNIVLVVSTGNLPILGTNGVDAEQLVSNYPNYLLSDSSRIIEPATGANVLTVGSLAKSNISDHMQRYPNDPAIRCIASVDQPSPFTRCGPGVNNAIKPELCEYGGNVTWEGHPSRILDRDRETGIISTNNNFRDGLFTSDIGTSFASPKVANIAASILKQYPEASANLVRSLLVNSTTIPNQVYELFNGDNDQILQVCGYGKPDASRAIFSSENRVTLFSEDTITSDAIHLFQIPIPAEFQETRGRRQISVTLAFDPPVRHTRKDYLGIKMKFKLLRGLETERIVEWYSQRTDDSESIPKKYTCNTNPSPTRRENGTVQKAIFTASQNNTFSDYNSEIFHLMVSSQGGWAAEQIESQNYAIVVTIEHFEPSIRLYSTIRQQVLIPQRVRVRI